MCNRETSGILVIDKPEGKTSTLVDSICKRILGIKKIGHLGTLDPFATGVLVVAINNGTKAIPYINPIEKVYEFAIKFGEKTNTGDKTGKIVETTNRYPVQSELEGCLPKFVGEITQTPHAFSAVKVYDGKRAYQIARQGGIPEIKPRKVTIFDLKLIDKIDDVTFTMKATVSPGTYIRSLCEDIASALGTVGHTQSLRRIRDGDFGEEHAISLDELREKKSNIDNILISLESVLNNNISVVQISMFDAKSLSFGQRINCNLDLKNGEYLAKSENGFLGIIDFKDGVMKLKKLLHPIL